MADGCKVLADKIEGGMAVRDAVAAVFEEARGALFSGNGYSAEWPVEAVETRGLLNLRTTPDAIDAFASDKNKALFSEQGVFQPNELEARAECMYDQYVAAITCEATTMVNMMNQAVVPAAAKDLAVYGASALAGDREAIYTQIPGLTDALKEAIAGVPDCCAPAARYCLETIVPAMAALREVVDTAEGLMSTYPYPSYTDVLLSHHVDAPLS